mmetsp:Transcript_14544/g.33936  ORF Transcript_14544/g.33936 Transcript_14544/m.33936 type:complete len:226 (+) Transcript_14544:10618-11295(+)
MRALIDQIVDGGDGHHKPHTPRLLPFENQVGGGSLSQTLHSHADPDGVNWFGIQFYKVGDALQTFHEGDGVGGNEQTRGVIIHNGDLHVLDSESVVGDVTGGHSVAHLLCVDRIGSEVGAHRRDNKLGNVPRLRCEMQHARDRHEATRGCHCDIHRAGRNTAKHNVVSHLRTALDHGHSGRRSKVDCTVIIGDSEHDHRCGELLIMFVCRSHNGTQQSEELTRRF